MKKILIGSHAMKHWFPDFNREPKDLDYGVDVEVINKEKNIEYLYNPHLPFDNDILNPNELLNLKISHLFWNNNWEKHMWDVQFLLEKGYKPDYNRVERYFNFFVKYLPTVQRSNTNQSKDDFFNNAVNNDINEHDNHHHSIASVPAFTKILKDDCEVDVDMDKFEKLSFDEKCDVINEETWVMAYERYNDKLFWVPAFKRQLKDNIIKHFPKPIAYFAIENYKMFLNVTKQYRGILDKNF